MAQIAGVTDVKVQISTIVLDGVRIAQFNGQAVVASHHIVERLELLSVATGQAKANK